MERNEILQISGTDYKEMTRRLLARADLVREIPAGAHVAIKPNLVTPTPASFGATTHPEIVAGIIETLQEGGHTDLVIAEGSWVGDRTAEAFTACGYRELSERYGVPILDTQEDGSHEVDASGMPLRICNCVRDFDYLINVPVLKGHCQTRVTCALKNMKGLIPNEEKRRYHREGLHRPIAHLNAAIHQDFIVVDHICGDPDFEEGGNPVTRNRILAARDPVLVDAYACSRLGVNAADVPYIGMAEKLGIGSADLPAMRLTSCDEEEIPEAIPARRLQVDYPVDEVDSCSACYGALIPALARLEEEGLLSSLKEKIAIGQGHRGRTGTLGVGDCTSGFSRYIKGCPPSSEDIYRELRAILTGR